MSFSTERFACSSFGPFIEPETSMTGTTQTGGRFEVFTTGGAVSVTTRCARIGLPVGSFSKVSWAVVFIP